MPNYNAKANSNNFGGLGPREAGKLGGTKKGENRRKRLENRKELEFVTVEAGQKKNKSKKSKK